MKWKYQIVRSDTVENFESSLNKLGSEGWEATPGAYAADEFEKVSLGQGMPPSMRVGANVGRSHEALHSGLIPGAAIKRRTLGLRVEGRLLAYRAYIGSQLAFEHVAFVRFGLALDVIFVEVQAARSPGDNPGFVCLRLE